MKKVVQRIVAVVLGGVLMAASVFSVPVYAAECTCADGSKGVETAVLGENHCVCGGGNGSEIIEILRLVVRVLTIGVGVLGAVGITIVGIQYITAGGNEEQTRKAKRRMFEIVIGIVAYVLAYAALSWLLPGGIGF